MVNSPFCASQGRAGRGQTLLFALPLRGQQAVIPAGTADPTYVQARSTRPNPIFFPDQLEPTIPFSCAVVDRRFIGDNRRWRMADVRKASCSVERESNPS